MRHNNRISSKKPRRTSMWCYGCDRATVSPDQKCPVCGRTNNTGKIRFKHEPLLLKEDLNFLPDYRGRRFILRINLDNVMTLEQRIATCPKQVKIDLTDALYKIKMKLKMLH